MNHRLTIPILFVFVLAVANVRAGPEGSTAAKINGGETTRVSVASSGAEGNGDSLYPRLSADGRFVVFLSFASDLVPGDTNDGGDVFVHDRQSGTTTRVSVDSSGAQTSGAGGTPAISADGRSVAFWSSATNLVPDDTNDRNDVFVHDRQSGITSRVSVDTAGAEGNFDSLTPAISADGRAVAFTSHASNLVPGDTNDLGDIFIHNRQSGITTRISVDSSGAQGNADSTLSTISGDGSIVAYQSWANNLVPGDTNDVSDVFVYVPAPPNLYLKIYLPTIHGQ